ncbi:MAG: hypothetical protein HFH29_07830 [Eubacterium sp.]|nr:hypothetical protein [Eubacterium sp.]
MTKGACIMEGVREMSSVIEEIRAEGRKEGREEGRREGIIATVETAVKFGASREFAIEAAVQQFHVAREYVETIYNARKQKHV